MEDSNHIRVAVAGLGNCAASLIEGIQYYRQDPESNEGLLFPHLACYSVHDIDIVAAFDISSLKVNRLVKEAIFASPNNFVRIPEVYVENEARVYRGPTLDGHPENLAHVVPESSEEPVDVVSVLKDNAVDVLVNLLPTGSFEATEFYAQRALEAGCAFINCIPTVLAQRPEVQAQFREKQLPLLGDDIKSQIGTTILHRALLHMLESRGATLHKTSQLNIGGNTDFANLVQRAEAELVSKRKSLARYLHEDTAFHVGHHYDPTMGPLKNAFIEIKAGVFGGSPVKLSIKLESDDKPNSAGSIVDLIRIAKGALDHQMGGLIPDACAFYFKSAPTPVDDLEALEMIRHNWVDLYAAVPEKIG